MGSPVDPGLLDSLLRSADEAWRDFSAAHGGTFHRFIPADYPSALELLSEECSRSATFLELGSGFGVVTILADLLGYDAYGIELEPELVEISTGLAEEFGSSATFVEGSFVPQDYRDEVHLLDPEFLSVTATEGADAYAELGMDLSDFDLVYVYPWPGEEEWAAELVRRHGGSHTRLMTYAVREGFALS